MKVIWTALVSLALVIGAATLGRAQPVEPRIAFVVGNGGYTRGPLPTALNDAGLVAEALRSIGFEIVEGADLSQADLVREFRTFLGKVEAAGPDAIAFVYFSGYGFTYDGDNLLVAADARLERDTDIPLDTIRLGDLLRPLAGAPARARIVVLDAARPLPFAIEGVRLARGLEAFEAAPGMLVASSAAPGAFVAQVPGQEPYGPYATALAEMLRLPGVDLTTVFTRVRARTHQLTQGAQTPWHVSALDPQLMLVPPDLSAPPPPPRAPRPVATIGPDEAYAYAIEQDTLPAYIEFIEAYPRHSYATRVWAIIRARRETLAWMRAREINTPESYWTYLRRYPDGIYAYDAERRLRRLSAAFRPPPDFAPVEFLGVPPPLPGEPVRFYDVLPPAPPPPVRLIAPPPAIFLNLGPPRPRVGPRALPAAAPLPGVRGFPPGGGPGGAPPAPAGVAPPPPAAGVPPAGAGRPGRPGRPPPPAAVVTPATPPAAGPAPPPSAGAPPAPASVGLPPAGTTAPPPISAPTPAPAGTAAPSGAVPGRRGPPGGLPAATLPPPGRPPASGGLPSTAPSGPPPTTVAPPARPAPPTPPSAGVPPRPPNAAVSAPPPARVAPPPAPAATAPRPLPPPPQASRPPPPPPAAVTPRPMPPPPAATAPRPAPPPPPAAVAPRPAPPPPPAAVAPRPAPPPPPATAAPRPAPPAPAAAAPKPAPALQAKKCTVENGVEVCR